MAATQQPIEPGSSTHAAVVGKYCVTCHNDNSRTGGLSLEHADLTNVPQGAETWEKVIRKLRVGMMPPPGMPRPARAQLDDLAGYLETRLDRAAVERPRPGRTSIHRLNRAEYANAIRDLLALDIDAASLLPPDDESSGFDNIADVLTVSPSLMERYLSAAWNISRLAVGNLDIAPSTSVYRARPDLSQDQHVDGLPPGTRGGILVQHTFPLDGEYIIKLRLWRNTFDLMRGMEDPHDIEIAMDGQRLTLVTAGGRDQFLTMAANPGAFGTELDQRLTIKVPVKAGPHTIWATTVLKSHAVRDDMIKPFLRTTVDGLDIMGDPSVDRLTIEGPYAATGSGDTRLPPKDLRLSTGGARGRSGLRHADPLVAGSGRLPSSCRQDDRRHVDGLLSSRARGRDRQQRVRSRHRDCASVHPRKSGVPGALRDRPAEACVERDF